MNIPTYMSQLAQKIGFIYAPKCSTFSLSKTKLEDLVNLVDAVIEEVSKCAPAFTGKCEDCGSAEAREIILMNGVPGYHCSPCQMRVAAEKQREADEYKARDANYV